MGILKDYIFEFLEKSSQVNEFQSGGTKGRRVTENMYVMSYCIERSFRMKKKLFILAIDFKKAYDSINRLSLIKVLTEFYIHPNIINLIAHIYTDDKTEIYWNKESLGEIEVSSGIRQGCNLSSLLFILVTYKIIEKIQSLKIGFKDKEHRIDTLFYMDDAAILLEEEYNVWRVINVIEKVAGDYGLALKKGKCGILCFNNEIEDEFINGIEVVDQIKYLGLKDDNKRQ